MRIDEHHLRLLNAYIDQALGRENFQMAEAHFGHGETIDAIAELTSLPRSTVHRRVSRVWCRMQDARLLPPNWKRQPAGRPSAPVIHSTDRDLFRVPLKRDEAD